WVFGEHIQTLKTYKLPEEFPEEIGEIHGLAVDAEGNFYLFQAENIVKFNNAEKVKATEAIEPSFNCEPKKGFAVAPKGEAFYVGHELETRSEECEEREPLNPAVIAKLDSAGNFLIRALDHEQSTAAAVDLANGDAFVDNEKSIAEFDSSGAPIQDF